MKRLIFGLVALIMGLGIGLYLNVVPNELLAFDSDSPSDRLPQEAKDYIAENFPETTIIDIDLEFAGYEVYLSNGVIIDFTLSGRVDWIEYGYSYDERWDNES